MTPKADEVWVRRDNENWRVLVLPGWQNVDGGWVPFQEERDGKWLSVLNVMPVAEFEATYRKEAEIRRVLSEG
jgi:hypothetical protein